MSRYRAKPYGVSSTTGVRNAMSDGTAVSRTDAEQGTGYPLVQKQRQHGNHGALHHVQRGHAHDHEGGYIIDAGVNGGAHADDGVQGHSVQLREFGQQVHGVEGGAEYGHTHGAQNQADDGTVLALVQVVEFDLLLLPVL